MLPYNYYTYMYIGVFWKGKSLSCEGGEGVDDSILLHVHCKINTMQIYDIHVHCIRMRAVNRTRKTGQSFVDKSKVSYLKMYIWARSLKYDSHFIK